MKLRTILVATASLALAADMDVMAQGPAPAGGERHLLFIATPGGGGGDHQSGLVVLDADHDYRFVKRISYGLPAAKMPGPQVTGIAASIPEQKLYVTTVGGMLAFDIASDKIVWEF